jgi:guanidinoacetate N-methyltransferase
MTNEVYQASRELSRKRRWGRIQLILDDDEFLRTRGPEQLRSWLLHRLLTETVADLEALDGFKESFAPGSERPLISDTLWPGAAAEFTTDELVIAGQQVMQAWETPLMAAMADVAAREHGDVLEVGFGMGISARMLQERGVSSHTIVELNDEVLARAQEWRAASPGADIRLVRGSWEETADSLGKFDAVFYDVYPVSDLEVAKLVQVPFPDQFFGVARSLLRPGGVFTYYTNEIDSLSRWHQRRLLEHFQRITIEIVSDLEPPSECHYWWAPSMAVVGAYPSSGH